LAKITEYNTLVHISNRLYSCNKQTLEYKGNITDFLSVVQENNCTEVGIGKMELLFYRYYNLWARAVEEVKVVRHEMLACISHYTTKFQVCLSKKNSTNVVEQKRAFELMVMCLKQLLLALKTFWEILANNRITRSETDFTCLAALTHPGYINTSSN
jgi:hypothetical protein